MLREQVMYIQPEKTVIQSSSSLKEQLDECLHSIKKSLAACGLETRDILKQTVFLKSADSNDFYTQKRELSALLKDFYKSFYPPTGFIGQPPVGGVLIAFELMVITRLTIENISRLIAPDNLGKHTLPVSSSDFPFSHIRVYVKNETDVSAVKKICNKHYGKVPCLYLVSDICRENLLVEIEGAIALPALSQER